MRAYHFETRTIKDFLSLWDKHATMPPERLAVCFDGRITIHDHVLTNTLRALSQTAPNALGSEYRKDSRIGISDSILAAIFGGIRM